MPEKKVDWMDIAAMVETALPLIEKLWTALASPNPPTQEQWDALKVATYQTAKDRMLKVLDSQGIDPESEQGKAFLALTV